MKVGSWESGVGEEIFSFFRCELPLIASIQKKESREWGREIFILSLWASPIGSVLPAEIFEVDQDSA
ncbi:MAG TPA: hypothetical protein DEG17_27265 [Cyanobacteria bacterium UBA11149]|nr:hypothetical protein [Cyanobacteria bacterium UBA11149]